MRAVRPPEYGPTGATTWVHLPTDDVSPPVPPSATYRNPSGPKVSPRGLFRPVAKTLDWGREWCEGRAATDAGSVSARSESTAAITILALFIISPFSGDGFIGWQREFNTTAIFGLKNLSEMVVSALCLPTQSALISLGDISRSENVVFRYCQFSILSSLENIAGLNIPYISTLRL